MSDQPRILYCHCHYAQVVPPEVKAAVLERLSNSGRAFDAVADLCELSARQDPALQQLAAEGPVKIAACFPRAVKWLFHTAKASLSPDATEVINMRTLDATAVCHALLDAPLAPNLPQGKTSPADAPKASSDAT